MPDARAGGEGGHAYVFSFLVHVHVTCVRIKAAGSVQESSRPWPRVPFVSKNPFKFKKQSSLV